MGLNPRCCVARAGVVQGLSWVDRLLVVWILGAMIIGVVCGKFAPVLRDRFAVAELYGTPLPIAVGLWLMMWPVLSKVPGTSLNMLPCTGRTPDDACAVCFATARKPGRMHAQVSRWGVRHGRPTAHRTTASTAAALLRLPIIIRGRRRVWRWHCSFTE